ncbi:hypothetical protein FRC12_017371 [Ceratobasidium sp. 428]|nr:hypothetical protein FRC12_017371 [Ceratobasidium sp. 428]
MEADDLDLVTGNIAQSQSLILRTTNMSATLAPISGLPSEISSQIFTHAAQPLDCSRPFQQHLEKHPLVAVSLVCTRWRGLAISMGSLWSHIHLEEYFFSNAYGSEARRWIELWLKRSSGAPLSLRFERGAPGLSDLEPIISLLQPHIFKVTSLVFHESSEKLVRAILTLYGTCSPSIPLETLAINYPVATRETPKLKWPVDNIQGLRTLNLCRLPDSLVPSFDELEQMLLNSPGLYDLRVRRSDPILPRNNTRSKVKIPNVQVLEIECDAHAVLELLLSLLDPGKKQLYFLLKHPLPISPRYTQEILEFFERANVVGLKLIKLGPESVTQLSTYLDRLPRLQILHLDCMAHGNCAILDALIVSGDGDKTRARRPELMQLYISNMLIDSEAQGKPKQIVVVHRLRRFVLAYGAVLTWSDPRGESESQDFLDWLRRHVPKSSYPLAEGGGVSS